MDNVGGAHLPIEQSREGTCRGDPSAILIEAHVLVLVLSSLLVRGLLHLHANHPITGSSATHSYWDLNMHLLWNHLSKLSAIMRAMCHHQPQKPVNRRVDG